MKKIALSMLGAVVVAAHADSPAPLLTTRATVASMNGQQIYEHICQGCHMAGGQGAAGAGFYPKLAEDKNLVSWQFVATTVLKGRNGMPPFGYPAGLPPRMGAHLSDAQIADVVNYVRSHFGNSYKPEATADGVARLPHPPAEPMGPQ